MDGGYNLPAKVQAMPCLSVTQFSSNHMKTKAKPSYRQGDVLLIATEQSTDGLKVRTTKGRVILAHGEATGHHHSFPRSKASDYSDAGGGLVVKVKPGSSLEHQEHTAIPIPPGIYLGIRQREYTPEAIRNVAD